MRKIVLASSSLYRRALLERLRLGFEWVSPQINENRVPGESAEVTATRLARLKAESLRPQFPDALIIGSDQCAVVDGVIQGKPGSFERAVEQLKQASGNTVEFHTGLCLLDSASGKIQLDDVISKVHFRELTEETIRYYVENDQPLDCAGSFRSEGLGIALFRRLEGDDPSALIGLPLIKLVSMLGAAGLRVV